MEAEPPHMEAVAQGVEVRVKDPLRVTLSGVEVEHRVEVEVGELCAEPLPILPPPPLPGLEVEGEGETLGEREGEDDWEGERVEESWWTGRGWVWHSWSRCSPEKFEGW